LQPNKPSVQQVETSATPPLVSCTSR